MEFEANDSPETTALALAILAIVLAIFAAVTFVRLVRRHLVKVTPDQFTQFVTATCNSAEQGDNIFQCTAIEDAKSAILDNPDKSREAFKDGFASLGWHVIDNHGNVMEF